MSTTSLTEQTYLILVSLLNPLHGYGIMKKVSELSKNRVTLAPGTLYGALNTLLNKNYIEIYDTDTSSKKKEYLITDLGKDLLESEINRLHELYLIGYNTLEDK